MQGNKAMKRSAAKNQTKQKKKTPATMFPNYRESMAKHKLWAPANTMSSRKGA